MWSSVLVLALVTAADPLRLFATFLVVSRPRPVPNLLAYLVGCLMLNVFILLIPLIVLHFTPMFRSFLEDLAGPTTAGGSTVQPVPIGIGGLALLIAAVMTVRLRVSQRANLPTRGGDTSTMVLESNTPTASSRPFGRSDDAAAEGSAIRRLLGRIYNAWEHGALWVSGLMGMLYSPPQVTIALTIIAASGAAIGAQLSAAIVFVVVMLAIVEIILVSCLVAPVKTQEVLRPLHDWVQARRRQVLAGVFAVIGLSLMATGMGII